MGEAKDQTLCPAASLCRPEVLQAAARFSQYIDYQDTDAGGIVYHGSYINFGERARGKLFRELFGSVDELLWVVKDLKCEYVEPTRLGEKLEVVTSVTKLQRCSVDLLHTMLVKDKIKTKLVVKLVSLNKDFKIVRFNFKMRVNLEQLI